MSIVVVKVKWGKEKFNLELDADEDPDTFRAQLFGLCGVAPESQKIMFKGKVITDSWAGIKLKANMSFLLMGSAKEVVAPTEKVVFEEDLSAAERMKGSSLPPGLGNQGNTCYLNSAVQCLRNVEGLDERLGELSASAAAAVAGGAADGSAAGGGAAAGGQQAALQAALAALSGGGIDPQRLMECNQEVVSEMLETPELAADLQQAIRGEEGEALFASKYGKEGSKPDEDAMELLEKMKALNKAAADGQAFETAVKSTLEADPNKGFSMALGNLYGKIKEKMSSNDINWAMGTFIVALRKVNPQYAEKQMHNGHSHGYMQQDAAEVWVELMTRLKSAVPFVEEIFTYKTEVTMTCDENPDEPAVVSEEKGLTMIADVNKDTGHVMACLETAMEGSLVKKSATLDRDAQYTKKSRLTRCPGYLAVNFKRFHYKVKEKESCKIRKDVKFQMSLDLMPIASKALAEKIKPQRDAFEAYRDATIAKEVTGYKADEVSGEQEYEPFSFPEDPGSNNSGYYELEAVLTHKGASTASGHYVAWCKQKDGKWLLFDDDKVSVQKEVDVLNLSGKSADGHIAYILLYGPKRMPKGGAEGVGGGGGGAAAAAAPAASMDVAADP